MGMVINLPRPKTTNAKSTRSINATQEKSAKILFFSGVRYSRNYEAPVKFAGAKRD